MDAMFPSPPEIATRIFTRLPDDLRLAGRPSPWANALKRPAPHSFLEGPSFDRDGNLLCVDVAHGRIFRISPAGDWSVFAHYDGHPNGLKIHRDGRIFVADAKLGLIAFDPVTAALTEVLPGVAFNGLNDLVFADNGDLYFSDPGASGVAHPVGRVFRLTAAGDLNLVLEGLAYPNGILVTPGQDALYVAITRTLQVWRVPLEDGRAGVRTGVFAQFPGGLVGPDGMAMDADGAIAVVQASQGVIWLVGPTGEPRALIRSASGLGVTNAAFGGPDGRTLFITEVNEGEILAADLPTPGRPMFSHL
jgi:gluconolactonase